ncbi:MAG: hypothetical protein V3U29_00610 [Phycisphaeraceae bacterium]
MDRATAARRAAGRVCLSLVALASIVIWAETVFGQDVPYTGVVTEPMVLVRPFTGKTFYPVGQLNQGDLVQVDEVTFGWYKIVPPAGIYSYISRAFVDAHGDGKTGSVNKDAAEVTAAGLEGPGKSYRLQLKLFAGDTVQIIGEEDSFYKIVPPQGAFVYLPPGSIRRATPAEFKGTRFEDESEADLAAPPKPEPLPEVKLEPMPVRETVVRRESEPGTPSEADPHVQLFEPRPAETPIDDSMPKAVSTAVQSLEQQMAAAMNLPLEQQPIERILDAYETASRAPDLPAVDRQIVAARIAQLKRNRMLAAAVIEANKLQQQIKQSQAKDYRPGPTVSRHYDAVGRLLASRVYNGQTLPRLFRLVEPAGGRTIAYIYPGAVREPARHVGMIVGVVGKGGYDPALKLKLIEAKQIDVLEPTGAEPATPAPTTGAAGQPQPQTTPDTATDSAEPTEPAEKTAALEPESAAVEPDPDTTAEPDDEPFK